MKNCYILNTCSIGGLEVYQIGDEKKLLDRIKTKRKVFSDYEKGLASKLIEGDFSMFFKGNPYKVVNIGDMDVYLSPLK